MSCNQPAAAHPDAWQNALLQHGVHGWAADLEALGDLLHGEAGIRKGVGIHWALKS
jgi:hypothetical protein